MEEKKVRIKYKIYGENDELKISLEIEEHEALEIFQKLYAYKQKGEKPSLEIKEEAVKKQEKRKTVSKQRSIETIYQKILNFISENGNVTARDIVNGIGANTSTVSMYLNKMKSSGVIINPDGIKTQYCIKNKSNRLPAGEKKQQETQKQGTFEKLISNERYFEIIDYIMKKDSFKMDFVRDKLQQYEELIPDVIKALTNKELINYKDETDEYVIPLTTKIWYVLLKEKNPVQDIYISYKLEIKFNKEFVGMLQVAERRQLIETVNRKGKVCYKAKLR